MLVNTFTPKPIYLTAQAIAKIKHLVNDENKPQLQLRVYVTGGGCSGFSYGFSFDDEKRENDTIVKEKGATVVIDALSFPYLQGATIDYQEGLEGARFVVQNPNAVATCGCGASFAL